MTINPTNSCYTIQTKHCKVKDKYASEHEYHNDTCPPTITVSCPQVWLLHNIQKQETQNLGR